MLLMVRQAKNGIVVSVDGEDVWVGGSSVEAWRVLFSELLEEYGPPSGRHDAQRLYLTVAPGDEHPDFTDSLFQ